MDKKRRLNLASRLNSIRQPHPGQPKGLTYAQLAEALHKVTGSQIDPSALHRFLNDTDRKPFDRTLHVLEDFIARWKPAKRGAVKKTAAA